MTLFELATAAIHKLPVKIIVIDNKYLGMVRQWQELFFDNRLSGVDLEGNPDFVKYAESYGARGHRVTSSENLLTTMHSCHAEPGVHVIEVPVDYSENDRILNHEIQERSAAI